VHGPSGIQARDLDRFLEKEENYSWVALTDVVGILNISKWDIYERYTLENREV
jgi:hypothetical protein